MKILRTELVSEAGGCRTLIIHLDVTDILDTAQRAAGLALFNSSGHLKKMHALKQEIVRTALELTNGNQQAAADLLGVDRNTLRKLIPPDERPRANRTRKQRPP